MLLTAYKTELETQGLGLGSGWPCAPHACKCPQGSGLALGPVCRRGAPSLSLLLISFRLLRGLGSCGSTLEVLQVIRSTPSKLFRVPLRNITDDQATVYSRPSHCGPCGLPKSRETAGVRGKTLLIPAHAGLRCLLYKQDKTLKQARRCVILGSGSQLRDPSK